MSSEWNGHLELFNGPQTIENLGNTCFEQIFYSKQSLSAPGN